MSVAAWRTLLRERAPLPVLLAVGAAQAASATVVAGAPLRALPLAVGAATIAAQLVMTAFCLLPSAFCLLPSALASADWLFVSERANRIEV